MRHDSPMNTVFALRDLRRAIDDAGPDRHLANGIEKRQAWSPMVGGDETADPFMVAYLDRTIEGERDELEELPAVEVWKP